MTTVDVPTAIQGQNVQTVAGHLGAPPVPPNQVFQFTLDALGRLSDVASSKTSSSELRGAEAAQIVRVKDVARVELSQQTYQQFSELNGLKAGKHSHISFAGGQRPDRRQRNTQAMAEMSKNFPQEWPEDRALTTPLFRATATIREVYKTLFEAGFLVLIVIMVFLQNCRAILVPATTVPVTIIGAFAAMAALGFTVNLMTLFALILAIGIVVDDAIVIVENSAYISSRDSRPKRRPSRP